MFLKTIGLGLCKCLT